MPFNFFNTYFLFLVSSGPSWFFYFKFINQFTVVYWVHNNFYSNISNSAAPMAWITPRKIRSTLNQLKENNYVTYQIVQIKFGFSSFLQVAFFVNFDYTYKKVRWTQLSSFILYHSIKHRALDNMHIFIYIMPISSLNPMFDLVKK